MDVNKEIQEFFAFEPKLLADAADKIVEAIKTFQDSEKEIDIQRKKIRRAKMISFRVRRMKARCEKFAIGIDCEIAVIEAQRIIDN